MKKKILYLEDEEDISDLVTRKLTRSGYDVIQVATIREANKNLRKNNFDLLIIDLNLPDGNGEEIINNVRSNPSGVNYQAKIIVISAHLDTTSMEELKARSIHSLQKPFSGKDLTDLVDYSLC